MERSRDEPVAIKDKLLVSAMAHMVITCLLWTHYSRPVLPAHNKHGGEGGRECVFVTPYATL